MRLYRRNPTLIQRVDAARLRPPMRSYRRGPRPPTAPPLVAVAGEVASGGDTTPGSDSSRSADDGEIAPGRPLHPPITSLPFAVADEVVSEGTLRPASVSPPVRSHRRGNTASSCLRNPVSEPHNRSHRHRRQQPLSGYRRLLASIEQQRHSTRSRGHCGLLCCLSRGQCNQRASPCLFSRPTVLSLPAGQPMLPRPAATDHGVDSPLRQFDFALQLHQPRESAKQSRRGWLRESRPLANPRDARGGRLPERRLARTGIVLAREVEEGGSPDETPAPQAEKTTISEPETPLEEIIRVPEHSVQEHLRANHQRARFVAKDVHEYTRSVPAGRVIKSSELRRVLSASEEGAIHTQTVSRVIERLDDLGKESARVRETQEGERVVVFTDDFVKRVVAFHTSNHIVVAHEEVEG
jgi:hypothetical protein